MDQKGVEVLPFSMNRFTQGDNRVNCDLPQVFGFDSFKGCGDPLNTRPVYLEPHFFESCEFEEINLRWHLVCASVYE